MLRGIAPDRRCVDLRDASPSPTPSLFFFFVFYFISVETSRNRGRVKGRGGGVMRAWLVRIRKSMRDRSDAISDDEEGAREVYAILAILTDA